VYVIPLSRLAVGVKVIVFPFQLKVPVGVAPFIRNAPCADVSSIASLKVTEMAGKTETAVALSAGTSRAGITVGAMSLLLPVEKLH
jgi:hypothetical protein